MLVAEVRRKILDLASVDGGDEVRRAFDAAAEDLLTADVFGVLKFLPRRRFLHTVLNSIASRNPSVRAFGRWLVDHAGELSDATFDFWPSLPTPREYPGARTEPDLLISTPSALILIEAKLRSGFGADQLERQLLAGLELAEYREFFLVVITAGLGLPHLRTENRRRPLLEHLRSRSDDPGLPMLSRAKLRGGAERVLWTNWTGVHRAMRAAAVDWGKAQPSQGDESHTRSVELVHELGELLQMRGLMPFDGVQVAHSQMFGYEHGLRLAGARGRFTGFGCVALHAVPHSSGFRPHCDDGARSPSRRGFEGFKLPSPEPPIGFMIDPLRLQTTAGAWDWARLVRPPFDIESRTVFSFRRSTKP